MDRKKRKFYNMAYKYNIAKQYGRILGGRWISLGERSGEDFFNQILEPMFKDARDEQTTVTFNLDGTSGYPSSFLDQSFGELARKYGVNEVRKIVRFETKVFNWIVDYINREIWDKTEESVHC